MPKILPPLLKECARATGISESQVEATAQLLSDDNTVPFIVRYRADATGGLDEATVLTVMRALESVRALDDRRKTILKQVEKHEPPVGSAVIAALKAAANMQTLEDLYLPYKPAAPKGHAARAREAGLGPLFDQVWARQLGDGELGGMLSAAARQGCGGDFALAETHLMHLVAERVASTPEVRAALRDAFWERAQVCVTAAKPAGGKAKAGAEGKGGGKGDGKGAESLDGLQRRAPDMSSHRILAMNRAETEGLVKVSVKFAPEQGKCIAKAKGLPSLRGGVARAALLERAADDAYDRLLLPALSRELRRRLSEQGEAAAVEVFALNLRRLLLQRPLPGTTVLGVDPGFRSGCKLAAVDASGRLLQGGVIFPHAPQGQRAEAMSALAEWVVRHKVGVVAVGNGTASRETQEVVAEALQRGGEALRHVRISVVNEAGASVRIGIYIYIYIYL